MNFFPSRFSLVWCTMNLQRILLSFGHFLSTDKRSLSLAISVRMKHCFLVNISAFLSRPFSRVMQFLNYLPRQKLVPKNVSQRSRDTPLHIPFNTFRSLFLSPAWIKSERWSVWVEKWMKIYDIIIFFRLSYTQFHISLSSFYLIFLMYARAYKYTRFCFGVHGLSFIWRNWWKFRFIIHLDCEDCCYRSGDAGHSQLVQEIWE